MRILLVNDYAAGAGGVQRYVSELRDALRERGHDARLLASVAEGGAPDFAVAGSVSRRRTLLQTANPRAWAAVRRVVRSFRPDVAHVQMFLTQLSPLALAPLRPIPTLHTAVWYRASCPIGTRLLPDGAICQVPPGAVCRRSGCIPRRDVPAHALQRALLRRLWPAIDRTVAVGAPVAAALDLDGWGRPPVLLNGVARRPARPPLADPPLVAYAGRLAREKGVDRLLRAFAAARAEVPEARLAVFGDGPAAPELHALAAELGVDGAVVFGGRLDPPRLDRRLVHAWVQAVPGRWVEPFGLVAAEALMRGTAVLTTDAGGPADIVRAAGAGLLVGRTDDDQLAGALRDLLRDRDRCERLGAAGRRWANDHLGFDAHVDRVVALYEKLAAG